MVGLDWSAGFFSFGKGRQTVKLGILAGVGAALLLTIAAVAAPTKVDAKKFKTTKSGLKYAIIKEGKKGGAVAKAGQVVSVHYTGWLQADGSKFDSSVDRGEPFSFPLGAGQVIKGWDEGVAGMVMGEKRQLVIPSSLGYGPRGTPGGPIPPNATLIFDVELLGAR